MVEVSDWAGGGGARCTKRSGDIDSASRGPGRVCPRARLDGGKGIRKEVVALVTLVGEPQRRRHLRLMSRAQRRHQALRILAVAVEPAEGVVRHRAGGDDELPVGRLGQQRLARRLLRSTMRLSGSRRRARGHVPERLLERPEALPRPRRLLVEPHAEVAGLRPRSRGEGGARLRADASAGAPLRCWGARRDRPAAAGTSPRGECGPSTAGARTSEPCSDGAAGTAAPCVAPLPAEHVDQPGGSCAAWRRRALRPSGSVRLPCRRCPPLAP